MIKRLVLILGCAAVALYAQEGHEAAHGGGDSQLIYKWINFAILAGGLGYLVIKAGVPALKAQQKSILDGLDQATGRAEAAQKKAAEAEKQIAGLETAVAAVRAKAEAELKAEAVRLQQETASQMAKLEQTAAQEIESAGKNAAQQVRAEAARLALELASARIAQQMTPETQGALVGRFIGSLEKQAARDRV
jgi:F0F1-type ATP synthase membrane subunit b/b'